MTFATVGKCNTHGNVTHDKVTYGNVTPGKVTPGKFILGIFDVNRLVNVKKQTTSFKK